MGDPAEGCRGGERGGNNVVHLVHQVLEASIGTLLAVLTSYVLEVSPQKKKKRRGTFELSACQYWLVTSVVFCEMEGKQMHVFRHQTKNLTGLINVQACVTQ